MSNDLHTMPLKVEKFLSSLDVRLMSWDEKGAYLLLLAEAWLNGGHLPGDYNALAMLMQCRCTETFQRIKANVIDKKFHERDGKLFNETLTEIYKETQQSVSKRRKAAYRKWEKHADAMHVHSICNADAMQDECSCNQIQSQIQSTRTSHTNVCSVATSEPSPLAATKRRKDLVKFDYQKGDWDWDSIPQDLADEWAKAYPAVRIEVEMRRAALWITAKPNRTKRDYNAFLVRWFSRQQERGGTK